MKFSLEDSHFILFDNDTIVLGAKAFAKLVSIVRHRSRHFKVRRDSRRMADYAALIHPTRWYADPGFRCFQAGLCLLIGGVAAQELVSIELPIIMSNAAKGQTV